MPSGGRPTDPSRVPLTLWCDGDHDATTNMARDEALLARVVAGTERGTLLRLFRFDPPGVTLGRAQDVERELDAEALARERIQAVRRPTGGRAIWHDEEWTFSLVTTLGPQGWSETAAGAYARTGALLAAALRRLGVPAELSPGSPRGPGAPRVPGGAAPPCFASTARAELTAEGRKLAGIAQRVVRGALLQQGSILLGDSHVRLARVVRVPQAQREALAAAWREQAAPAGRWLRHRRELAVFADAVAAELGGPPRLQGEAGAASLGLAALPRPSG
jgi:lipoate-protein ligase A